MSESTTTEEQRRRLERLHELAEQALAVYDPATIGVLTLGDACPRYALVTSEGSAESSYADNPNVTVHGTREELAEAAAAEAGEGWIAREAIDLDTGEELGITYRVELS